MRGSILAKRLLVGLAVSVLLVGCASNATPSSSSLTATTASSTAVAAPTPIPTFATAAAAAATTLPPAARRPQTIHVLEDPIDFHSVAAAACTSAAGCKGDQLIGTSRMLDADTRVDVGSLSVKCVLMDPGKNLYHCPANTISLTGRGQIVFDETVYIGGPWYPKPWPIISGSGEFLGARGTVTSPADSTYAYGDYVITITK